MRDARFDLYCLARETPRKVIYFGSVYRLLISCLRCLPVLSAGVVFTHSVIWTMTLLRRSVAVRSGWGHIPVVNLVFRDGAYIFICICGTGLSTCFCNDSQLTISLQPCSQLLFLTVSLFRYWLMLSFRELAWTAHWALLTHSYSLLLAILSVAVRSTRVFSSLHLLIDRPGWI